MIFLLAERNFKNGLKPEVLSMLKVFGPYLNEDELLSTILS